MSTAKTIAAIKRTSLFKALLDANLYLESTDRQLKNGTLVFRAQIGEGKKAKHAEYSITSSGAVISNKFVARRVSGVDELSTYRNGLEAITELLNKRLETA